ncbi:MAG TPA: hypothetical protein VLJ62_09710, partial [Burkholderiaceae bacterium]|nr:hypothetical protein [Burkholderiaceae bacterium]
RMRSRAPMVAAVAMLVAMGTSFGQSTGDRDKSIAAFKQIAQVMRSPRCMNCHTVTDFPRQGNQGRRHDQMVMRGADGKGTAPMQCSACHQESNSSDGYVPGAPAWHLAPLSMGWEQARGDKELCEALLDKKRNGNREARGMVIHMTNDPLVQWAWAPGRGRTLPPISQDDFHALLQVWEATGAVCPSRN